MQEHVVLERKKQVPQVNPATGISGDYNNQIVALIGGFKRKQSTEGMKILLKAFPFHMEKYEDVYSEYANVVNDKNRDRVARIDELAGRMNEIVKDPDSIDEAAFRATCNELNFLIYGDTRRDI